MPGKLFAFFGWKRARRWNAQAAKVKIEDILEWLLGADSPLPENDYLFIEGLYPPSLKSEYQKEYRKLRRKYTIIGCKMASVECSKDMDIALTPREQQWLIDEERRTKRRQHPSLAFAEPEKERTGEDEPKLSDQITN